MRLKVALRVQIWIIGPVERAVPHNKIKAKENTMISCDLKIPGKFEAFEVDGKFFVRSPSGELVAEKETMEKARATADSANRYIERHNADRA